MVCLLLAIVNQSVFAQSTAPQTEGHSVSGVVLSDSESLPLPGVNILLAGTTVGVATDGEGRFKFPTNLKVGDKLVVSSVSYVTQPYLVTGSENEDITVRLKDDAEIMGEIASNEAYRLKARRNLLSVLKRPR